MNTDERTDGLEQRAREVFDESVAALDAQTRSRLNHARQAALDELRAPQRWSWRGWAPAGAFAVAVLAAVLLWRAPDDAAPSRVAEGGAAEVDVVEIVASGEDLELASEELEFYEWLAVQPEAARNGNG
jgi:hypothetical protein